MSECDEFDKQQSPLDRLSPTSSTRDILSIALDLERAGHDYYVEATSGSLDPAAKDVFARLANEELVHIEFISKYLGEDMPEMSDLELAEQLPRIGGLVFPPVPPAPIGAGAPNDLAALLRGIRAERDSIRLYCEATLLPLSPPAHSLFARLVEVERDHLALLSAEYDYATKSGFFFGVPEFSLEALVE